VQSLAEVEPKSRSPVNRIVSVYLLKTLCGVVFLLECYTCGAVVKAISTLLISVSDQDADSEVSMRAGVFADLMGSTHP